MNVRRTPGVGVVAPRIRARLDGDEAVIALAVGEDAARAQEIRIERRRMIVARVAIAARRIGLPDLHQRVRHAAAVFIQHPAGHDDALALRRLGKMQRQVVIGLADRVVAVDGSGQFAERMRQCRSTAARARGVASNGTRS